ncbi:MAG: type III-A CRISPR-associated RAMP protein Csm5 [Syntrophobacteraceae bacterium]
MNKTMRFCLRILTPVHIGCDEVYEPTAFVIDREKQQLRVFDPIEFLRLLNEEDKKKFSAICQKGTLESILELYRFMRQKCPSDIPATEVTVCGDLVNHYAKNLQTQHNFNMKKEFNTFVIPRTAFNPNSGLPYIPGSSVKGALRTAYLNARQKKKPASKHDKGKDLEKELLEYRSFETDPFKLVKVSDFMPIVGMRTKIVYGVNRKKKPGQFEAGGPPQILEVVEPGCFFEGWISIDTPMTGSGIAAPITLKALLDSVRAFYTGELDRENKDLQGLGGTAVKQPDLPLSHILRVGRHSGAECVTIEGHRNIRIMRGKQPARFGSNATTLWFAADSRNPTGGQSLVPFGWAILESLTDEVYQQIKQSLDTVPNGPLSIPKETEIALGEQKTAMDEGSGHGASERPKPPQCEMWRGVSLYWDPSSRTVTATTAGEKAFTKDQALIPESIKDRLCGKRKPVLADIEVEPAGGKNFKITRIDPLS